MRKKISEINKGNKYNLGRKHNRKSVELRIKNMDWKEIGPKISKAKKGVKLSEHHKRQLKVPKGPMNEETKQKLSLAQKGIPKIKTKKPVIQLDINNNFIKEWDSQTDAGLALGIKPNDISSAIYGRQKTAGGYKWLFKKDYE